MRSPYIEAAKMAFMVAGGAGVAFAVVKGITVLAKQGFAGILGGLMSSKVEDTTATTTTPDDTNGSAT